MGPFFPVILPFQAAFDSICSEFVTFVALCDPMPVDRLFLRLPVFP